jgi:molybdate transport system substrate-binding protein
VPNPEPLFDGEVLPMRKPKTPILAAASLAMAACALLPSARADAPPLKVLTAGALKPIVAAMVARFETKDGPVDVENDTAGALTKRIEGGEACDVVILTEGALKTLATRSAVLQKAPTPLAKVGIGVAVRTGTPLPDISTVDAFKRTVLAAPSVAYLDPAAGGSSGIYLVALFKRLGIDKQVAAKAVPVPGGLVADRLVDGRAALAIHQISEILAVKGVTLVGPLPAAIQNYTVYAASPCGHSQSLTAAAAFITTMAGPDAAALFKAKGMEPAH